MLLKKKLLISADELALNVPTVAELPRENSDSKKNEGIKNTEDKYYLPVLNINHIPQWESKPINERKKFTDEVALETCLGNCCGVEGLKGACCHLDPVDLEHVLGPVDEDWIRDTIKWFRKKNIPCNRTDLVIDYEEGKFLGETLLKMLQIVQSFNIKNLILF